MQHGLRNPDGPDNGDLPNLFVAADGTARAEFFTTLVSVTGGDMPALLDDDGSAVIIHENPDDHLTQPHRRRGRTHRLRRDREDVVPRVSTSIRPAADDRTAAGRLLPAAALRLPDARRGRATAHAGPTPRR